MNSMSMLEALRPENWPMLALLSARVAGLMTVAPIWSMQMIPRRIRGAFAVTLTLVMLPLVSANVVVDRVESLLLVIGGELLLGILIGLTASVLLHAVRIGAEIVSVQMGLSIASQLLPGSADTGAGVGQLQSLMVLAMYVTVGGHLTLILGLHHSLEVIPPGMEMDMILGGGAFVAIVGTVFTTAVRVAAPVMVALVLTNVALAILGKAVPQLNVLMVAFPVMIGVGLIALGASLPFLASFTMRWVDVLPQTIDRVVGAFAPAMQTR